jgi:hypothetical protein
MLKDSNMQWNLKKGKYWMLQWGEPIFFSLGIHIDPRKKYIDFHIIYFIFTIGDPKAYIEYESWWSARDKDKTLCQ